MTVWLLVHRSTVAEDEVIGAKLLGFFASADEADRAAAELVDRWASYRAMPEGFERFELPLDEEIPEELSDRMIWGEACDRRSEPGGGSVPQGSRTGSLHFGKGADTPGADSSGKSAGSRTAIASTSASVSLVQNVSL